MRRRIDRKFPLSTAQPQDKVVANDALATPVAKSPVDEKAELEQVTALFSFLEDRYSKKVRCSVPVCFPRQGEKKREKKSGNLALTMD